MSLYLIFQSIYLEFWGARIWYCAYIYLFFYECVIDILSFFLGGWGCIFVFGSVKLVSLGVFFGIFGVYLVIRYVCLGFHA